MVSDPYKVLGVPQGASQDEIKKAYRKKAKECHPDLHPDDPSAPQRMKEVNEAYDMLMNPEKYAGRRQQEQAQQNPYGQGNPYGWQGNPYGQGWSPFDDMFGFGGQYGSAQTPPPRDMPGDSQAVRQAIYCINTRQYQAALGALNSVPAMERNARWHYLISLAEYGMGNNLAAAEEIRIALEMEPGNALYQRLYQQYRAYSQTYQQNARGFDMHVMDPRKLCLGLCFMQLCCRFGWCCC